MIFNVDPYFLPLLSKRGMAANSDEGTSGGSRLSLYVHRRRKKKRRPATNSVAGTAAVKPYRPQRTEHERVSELNNFRSIGTEHLINAAIQDGRQLVDILDEVIAAQQEWNGVLATAREHGRALSGFRG